MPPPPEYSAEGCTLTRDEVAAAAAHAAWQRGDRANRAGDPAEARRWLERARRLAPADPVIAMSLATVLLALADPGAVALFREVASGHDLLPAWLGWAASSRLAGDHPAACQALARALSGHSHPEPDRVAALASAVAVQSGEAGWCCVGADRRLGLHPARSGGAAVVVRANGTILDWRPGSPLPAGAREVTASQGRRPLLGSPLRVAHMFRVEGVAGPDGAGGIEGWAWHPGAPGLPVTLALRRGRRTRKLLLSGGSPPAPADAGFPGFARPARFSAAAGPGAGPVHVFGDDGRELTGSPIDPAAEIAGRAGGAAVPATAPAEPGRPVAVVIPVYRGLRTTLDCLASVRASVPPGTRVIVVDDATPEPELAAALGRLASAGDIELIRRGRTGGFPAAANAGLRRSMAAGGRVDVVLLNSDTLVPPGWLAALRSVVHARPDTGTATPLSNDATLASYPVPGEAAPAPGRGELRRLAAQAARANPGVSVEVPTAVGFCMYIRRECLDAVGLLREDLFARGYGEENDFCLRARRAGWRHVVAPGVFVAHLGGASFGAARLALGIRNAAVIERLHPGYAASIAGHFRDDPLAPARARLDAVRWQAGRCPGGSVVLVTHDSGGGVERVVRARCRDIRAAGSRPIVLRPVRRSAADPSGPDGHVYRDGLCIVGDGTEGGFPNLRFTLPDELHRLAALLRADRPRCVELHHLLGHARAVTELAGLLGVPTEIHVHDYACICPRITLVGPERRFCGEPLDTNVCDSCIAEVGALIEEPIPPAALRARSAADFAGAGRVVVPARDAARRLDRHFPGLRAEVVPWDRVGRGRPERPGPGPCRRIVLVGGLGVEKGHEVLLACARDAAARGLRLEFVVVGHTPDDEALFETGRVFVTGPYAEQDGEALVRAQRGHLAWFPSVCPETWSFALSLAWQAGLRCAVFDIGAPAERVRASGEGWIVPLGAPPGAINAALLAASPSASDEWAQPRPQARSLA